VKIGDLWTITYVCLNMCLSNGGIIDYKFTGQVGILLR